MTSQPPRPAGLTGSSLMILPVVGALTARGVDPSPLLLEVGIDARTVSNRSARFADESVQALWLRVPDFAGDPDFGLSAAKLYRSGMFWILDDLVASAETLRDAFELGHAHMRLLHDAADARLVQRGPLTRLEILPDLAAPIARAQMEFFVASVVHGARRLTGTFEHPREVHFRHVKPNSTAALSELLECPLNFGGEVTAIVFPTEWLDAPVVHPNTLARSAVVRRANELLRGLEEPFDVITRVRMVIGRDIGRTEPSLNSVAKRIGMSPRTLRRRLYEAGTSYSKLVDLVRQRYAARYLLEASASIGDIAHRLGFANPAAFFKAHRRWTGLTPREARDSRDLRMMGL